MNSGYFSKMINRGGSSGPSNGGSTHDQRLYLRGPLYRMARALPPEPRVARKVRKPNKIYQPHLNDEQAKDVIRSFLSGTPQSVLVDRTGFSPSCIRSLCNGQNRGHLLREVEMEPKQMMGGK